MQPAMTEPMKRNRFHLLLYFGRHVGHISAKIRQTGISGHCETQLAQASNRPEDYEYPRFHTFIFYPEN